MSAQLIAHLNAIAGAIAGVLLAPLAWLPGWLSLTLVAAITGVLMLLAFKYTSNQSAIKHTRNQIKANLLALSLFKDSVAVSLRAQGRILSSAGKLMVLSIIPMLVMLVPTCLLLGQLGLWFQARPLQVGEDAVIAVHLAAGEATALNDLQLAASSAVKLMVGPVRVPAKQMVYWNIQAAEPGCHELSFEAAGETYKKELVIGDGVQRTSIQRPAMDWTELLLHPLEKPFAKDSVVQSIEVDYPQRSSWLVGSKSWLFFWFAISMVAAFIARPLLKVSI